MKRVNKNKKKVLAYALGGDANGSIFLKSNFKFDPSNIAGAALGASSLLSNFVGTSTATSGGEATMRSLQGIASGAGAGAQIGSMFGPAGALIGGAAGGLAGVIGKEGREAKMTSFTDYDSGTLGTGFFGFGNKELRRRRAVIKTNAFNNRAGVAATESLGQQYSEDDGSDPYAFAEGGLMSSSLAYVDDGELIQTPEGLVSKVPEMGQPTDSNLVQLPEGSRVLSDKLKVPGTKKTFAQIGEKMMTKKVSKGKDKYAKNAAKLNEMNNSMIHDLLFLMQEAVKIKRGIGNKNKSVESFAEGGKKRKGTVEASFMSDVWHPFGYNVFTANPETSTESLVSITNPGVSNRTRSPKKQAQPSTINAANPALLNTRGDSMQVLPNYNMSAYPTPDSSLRNYDPSYTTKGGRGKGKGSGFDVLDTIGDVASSLGSLAPALSNIFAKQDNPVQTNYNPYAGTISKSMRNRRFNIDPAIQDITTNRAISNYNADQSNTNTGANMAYRLLSAVAANNAISNLRSQQSNVNNQYSADYANTLNNLGQQWVQATNMSDDLNARNRATTGNINRTGLSQLSQWAQNNQLMYNQKKRDKQLLPLYKRFLEAGFTKDDLNGLIGQMRNTSNKKG